MNHSRIKHEVEPLPGFNKLVRGRHGLYIANENDEYIGRALIRYGEFSELEWKLLRRCCEPGAEIVEAGANIGAHTVSLGKAARPGGRVIAIEPQPLIFQTLCGNLSLNGLTNVVAINCGCGSQREMLRMPRIDYAKRGNFGGVQLERHNPAISSIPIGIHTLNELLVPCEKVNLIKIDVEGMESEVIAGGTEIIRKFRPILYVENDRLEKSKSLIELIGGLGYRMWWHLPCLYNSDNYFGNGHNLYPGIASFNMLCIHSTITSDIYEGLREVDDSDYHPLAAPA